MSHLPKKSKFRLNGQPVRVVNGQMVDFLDYDFNLPSKTEVTCTCGAQAVGCLPYAPGHADYCDVHETKLAN